jgi:hypothetical protein
VRRVRAIPGVELASMTTDLPVTHLSPRVPINIEDRPARRAARVNPIVALHES